MRVRLLADVDNMRRGQIVDLADEEAAALCAEQKATPVASTAAETRETRND